MYLLYLYFHTYLYTHVFSEVTKAEPRCEVPCFWCERNNATCYVTLNTSENAPLNKIHGDFGKSFSVD